MEKSASQVRHPVGTCFYWTFDVIGWGILVFFSAILAFTGRSVHAGLLNAGLPFLADMSAILVCIIVIIWLLFFGSFRPLKFLVTTPDRLIMSHGPWRHVMLWRDIARVSEWSVVQDHMTHHWIAVWSADGMRIQIRSDLVGDFAAFRSDVLRRLARAGTMPDAITNVDTTLTVTEDVIARILLQGTYSLILILLGAFLLLATSQDIFGIISMIIGGGIFLLLPGVWWFRMHIAISSQGIGMARGPFHTVLQWQDIYALQRSPDARRGGILSILGRGLLLLLFRIDRRSGIVFGAMRQYSIIELSGNSGVDIRIHERNFIHPEWIRARLRAEVEMINHQVSTKSRTVEPLPKTGPLAPGTVLPPDPIEGDSTLWLRESMGTDPFRINHEVRQGDVS